MSSAPRTSPGPDPEIADVVRSMYRSLGDRAGFDRHLHPGLTIWESDAADLLRGLPALDRLRDERRARAAGGPSPAWVRPELLAVDRWGDVAVARYLLRAHHEGVRADEVFRVTDVLRRDDVAWRIVHHHAERVDAGAEP